MKKDSRPGASGAAGAAGAGDGSRAGASSATDAEGDEARAAASAVDEAEGGHVSGEEGEAGEGESGEGEPGEELDAEAAELQAELEVLNDRHLRLAAEFDNFRRRAHNEMLAVGERAQADLVRRLLDSLDDLQRVVQLDPGTTSVAALLEGVELVERKLVRALEEAGAQVVDPDGERFDPETMEAVMRVPASSHEEDDQVDQVFQKGYRLKGQLVRPARVSVRKHE